MTIQSQFWNHMFAFGGVVPTGIFAFFAAMAFLERRAWRVAASWPLVMAVAIAIGTATKVMYYAWDIEFGFGKFHGFSGHTLRAAAVYPVFAYSLFAGSSRPRMVAGLAVGSLIACMVVIGAVRNEVHTFAEALAGAITGAIAAVAICSRGPLQPLRGTTQMLIVACACLLWFATPIFDYDLEQRVVDFSVKLRH
jgi:hypothetical protein